jgi:hypothetical protein
MPLSLPPYANEDLTPGERTFLNRMKAIYDGEKRESFLYVQPRIGQLEPDFVLIDPYKGVLVVEVKDWSLNYITQLNQKEARLSDGRRSRNPAFRCNQYLRNLERLLLTDLNLEGANGNLAFPVLAKVFFPNISDQDLSKRTDVHTLLDQYPVKLLTSNSFRNCSSDDLFGKDTLNISKIQVNRIRALLFPETVINVDHNSIHADSENAPILEPGQERLYQRPLCGHYLSTGIPGSGKTKILLARALFLAKKKPNWRILILTYTRSLKSRLEHQLETHSLSDAEIKKEAKISSRLSLSNKVSRPLLVEAVSMAAQGKSDELVNFVEDKLIGSKTEAIVSRGEQIEDAVLDVYELCESVLNGNDESVIDEWLKRSEGRSLNHNVEVSTFHSFAYNLSRMEKPPNPPDDWWSRTMPAAALANATPMYDAVLVDEYQDFHDDWFRLCKKICRTHQDGKGGNEESLWFAGDQLQSIWVEKPQSWKSVDLNVRGRSSFIKKTYRASSSHIALATKWLSYDESMREEVSRFYPQDGYSPKEKKEDEIEFVTGGYDKLARTIESLLRRYKPGEILILYPEPKDSKEIFDSLPDNIRDLTVKTKETGLGDKIILTTYWSSKGLESKVAVLAGIDSIAGLSYKRLTPAIRRKLVYVGLTRASEKLIIHSKAGGGQYGEVLREIVKSL